MGRKSISPYKLKKLKKLLLEGKTSNQISTELKISTSTVSNYRSYFKKHGGLNSLQKNDTTSTSTKQNIEKKFSSIKISKPSNSFSSSYKFIVNGTCITFKHKPKSIIIGKNEFIVDV